jgi:tripartite-type tricarboxylate transporter receptor subunit TctC
MKLARRKLLRLAVGAAALPAVSRIAQAQAYPARPVHIVVGFRPNGPTDYFAHLIGRWLSERLGQPFFVVNRSGSGSALSIEAVADAPPDGYTLLLLGASAAGSTSLYPNPRFNLIRDIAPVTGIARVPLVMQANTSVPAKTVPELSAYAKGNASGVVMATIGDGTTPHLAGELFNMMATIDLPHVAYSDSSHALNALLQAQAQVYFGPIAASIGYIRSDKLRALAVTSATRSDALPEVPTVAESLPGYEAIGWYGLGAPKNTPSEIIDRLNTEINAALVDPKTKVLFGDLGAEPMPMAPAVFGAFIGEETEKWAKVIKFANIKPE